MIDFATPKLATEIEKLSAREIDKLPFGVIKLDAELRVALYSKTEGRLSGYGERPILGKLFFSEIAPCMSSEDFLGKVNAARARGTLDLEFNWIGDFSDRSREIHVRIQSASGQGVWIFLSRGG